MPLIRSIFQWRVIWAGVLCMLAFWSTTFFVDRKTIMQFLNICTLSVAVAIVCTYAPIWARTLMKRTMKGSEALSLGIGCTWTAEIGQRMWSIVWNGLDQPSWMTASMILPLLLTLNLLGGIQHITAPGAMDGVVPRRNWIVLGATAGFATLIGLMVLWMG